MKYSTFKHIIIAPDKFKGSLSTFEACAHIAKGVRSVDASIQCHQFPVADGGDGFQQVIKHYLHTKTIHCAAVDPLHRPITASYELDSKTNTAIIELAIASGLVLLQPQEINPFKTSTLGTGMLIQHAIQNGCTKILLGLGGSATNDAGVGILHALGFRFYDSNKELLEPCGGHLSAIDTIRLPDRLPAVEFLIATDVQNVLHGRNGAAYGFARQKGADEAGVQQLDAGLVNVSRIVEKITNKKVDDIPGSGAAGGIAAGLMAFFPVTIKSGIEMIMDISNIRSCIHFADLVITGEGKMDEQTMTGKVIAGVLRIARDMRKPVVICCGENTLNASLLLPEGVIAVSALMERADSREVAIKNAGILLEATVAAVISRLRS